MVLFARSCISKFKEVDRNVAEVVVKHGSGRACVPASAPHKGASIVSGAGEGSNKMFVHGSTSFWHGNAAARTFERAHRHRPYHSDAHRRSAKVKIKVLMLA